MPCSRRSPARGLRRLPAAARAAGRRCRGRAPGQPTGRAQRRPAGGRGATVAPRAISRAREFLDRRGASHRGLHRLEAGDQA